MRVHGRALLALPLALLAAGACSDQPTVAPAPDDLCAPVVWVRPTKPTSRLAIIGSWDDWRGPGVSLQRAETSGYAGARVPATAGEFGYLVVEDGVPRLDADNPLTTFRGDNEVSLLEVPPCGAATLTITKIEATDGGAVSIEARLADARTGKPRDLADARVTSRDTSQPAPTLSRTGPTLTMSVDGLPRGRHSFAITATDGGGNTVTQRVSAWVSPRAKRWDDALVYQIMIDRFRGDEGAFLAAPSTPAAGGQRLGGTLSGVKAALTDGSLDALGVSALWLSPVYQNPSAPQTDRFGNVVTSYHGYWPIDDAAIEPRFGGEAALREVIELAHAKGIRVLLDVVPNHVFDTHPVYAEHRDDGWFHQSSACVCGSSVCPWSTHIEDCWFTPYLPDFRFENPAVSQRAAREVTRWMVDWDLDGVRIDAVPMMKRSVTRRIARDVRRGVGERNEALLLGEIFTGPGPEGIESIRPFLGPDALDSAFDFPGMWALRSAFRGGGNGGSLAEIESLLATEDARYAGSGTLSARIIGNHDVSRFVSDAAGNGSNDPWRNPPAQPAAAAPYDSHRLGLAFLLTMPGMPVLYYGDEMALAGAGDPDCRRPLPPSSALSDEQAQTLTLARKLGALRACAPALRDPARKALITSPELLVYERAAGASGAWIVAFPTADAEVPLTAPAGTYRDVLGGGTVTLPGTLSVRAGQPLVLGPVGDPCLGAAGVELATGSQARRSRGEVSPPSASQGHPRSCYLRRVETR